MFHLLANPQFPIRVAHTEERGSYLDRNLGLGIFREEFGKGGGGYLEVLGGGDIIEEGSGGPRYI